MAKRKMECISFNVYSRWPQSAETLLKSTDLSSKQEIIALGLRSNEDLYDYWKSFGAIFSTIILERKKFLLLT